MVRTAKSAYMTDNRGRRLDEQEIIGRTNAPVPFATRATPPNLPSTNLSDGVLLQNTYRLTHTALVSAYGVRLVFSNFYNALGTETVGPNAIAVKASVEVTTGSPLAITFGGSASVTILPGQSVVSDPLGVEIVAGTTFYTRTFVSVTTSGHKWPLGLSTSGTRAGEGNTSPVSGADWTTATWTVGSTQISNTAYGPTSILGIAATPPDAVVVIVGDSIAAGLGDAPPNQNRGFITRQLDTLAVPYQQLAYASAGVSQFISPNSYGRKGVIPESATHAIVELGINAVASGATLAAVQAPLVSVWSELARRRLRVTQTTLTPSTTSSDSWATLGNQTVQSFEAVRLGVNNWIRDGAPLVAGVAVAVGTNPAVRAGEPGHPLVGWHEIADLCESARDSGKWRVDLGQPTTDGVHPATVVVTAMSAGISIL